MFENKILAPTMAALFIFSGLAQVAPTAQAQNPDCTKDVINDDFNDWLSVTQPAADQISASRFIQFLLFPGQGSGLAGTNINPDTLTNGIDAYVHDFGCEMAGPLDWCITGIRGSEQITLDNGRLIQLEGRDDDWRVQFYDGNLDQLGDTVEYSTPQVDDEVDGTDDFCRPGSTNLPAIPDDTHYAVIWIDSSEVVNDDENLDATENLIPRGYQTEIGEGLPGVYTSKFHFDTCLNVDENDDDQCD